MSITADHTRAGSPGPDDGDESLFEDLIEELTDRLQAGDAVDVEAFLGRHPAHAERLRRLIPSLELMDDLGQWSIREVGRVAPPPTDPAARLGALGDFRLVREVGRGGMGIVYEAQQVSLGRRVALKLLPMAAAMDPKQIQRFQVEAQAAACLHHPHIVPVHGVGCERGVHYYAMQLIEGQSLAAMIAELRRLDGLDPGDGPAPDLAAIATTDLAARLLSGGATGQPGGAGSDSPTALLPASALPPHAPAPLLPSPLAGESRRAGTKGRMRGLPDGQKSPAKSPSSTSTRTRDYVRAAARLALQAAEALDHAHARGILHRDIKPANLLLDAEGRLWVADFGLAQIQGSPSMTLTGDVLGTLRYMSPEQALGKRVVIDGRTDVYSLGVTLYELLTLRPALDGKDRAEILRKIASDDTPPLRRLNPSIPPDLETIIHKAMAKEPAERYATAKDLADDLRSFLEDRPIRARRPRLLDRFAKISRRHRSVVTTAVLLLVLGTAVSTWQAVRATMAERAADKARADESSARKRAETAESAARAEAEKATAMNDFLTHDLLGQADPSKHAVAQRITLREVLDLAADRVGTRFRDRPLVEAALRSTLGETYWNLGVFDRSRQQYAAARALYERELGPDAPETANAMSGVGQALHRLDKDPEAEPLLRQALDALLRARGVEHPDTLAAMEHLSGAIMGSQEADTLLHKRLEVSRRVFGPEDPRTLHAMATTAEYLVGLGRLSEAEPLAIKALELGLRVQGEDHPYVSYYMYVVGRVYGRQGKLPEAERLYARALELALRTQGEGHIDGMGARLMLASVLEDQGKLSEAERLYAKGVEVARHVLGDVHAHTLQAMGSLARLYTARGQWAQAEALWREVLAIQRRKLPADRRDSSLSDTLASLSFCLLSQQRAAEAEPHLREGLAIREAAIPDHWLRYNAMSLLGGALLGQAKYAEAEPLLLSGYKGMEARERAIPTQGRVRLAEALERIVQLYESWGQPDKAAEWRTKLARASAGLPTDVFARP